MTEALKTGMIAINKWLFHAWNYESVSVSVPDYANNSTKEIIVPQFIAEAKWTCNLLHMIGKWQDACRSHNTNAYLVDFYANLDGANRKILLEWVLENYNGEKKLFE